jgi:N-acetylmuramoyl-L-alanine amidase
MKFGPLLVFSITVLAAQERQPPVRQVVSVRHTSTPTATRIDIEVTGDFTFRKGRMHNPETIYFDLLNTARHPADSRGRYDEDFSDDLVRQILVEQPAPRMARVVLSVAPQVEATTSRLANPTRLSIVLRRVVASQGGTSVPRAPSVNDSRSHAPSTSRANWPPLVVQPATAPKPGGAASNSVEDVGMAARSGDSSLTRALGLKVRRIAIDPGHGGPDPGTKGPRGLLEKELVLDISRQLAIMLRSRLGWEVILTRNDDRYQSLDGRTAIANNAKADLFLSIHGNSSSRLQSSGVEIYYLNITGNKDALAVAARENANAQKSLSELAVILDKISTNEKAEESREFAADVQHALAGIYRAPESDRGVKTAPFIVLIGAKMPSILAEVGFLSNPVEEALLKSPEHRRKVAEALFRGVEAYANSLSHFPRAEKP